VPIRLEEPAEAHPLKRSASGLLVELIDDAQRQLGVDALRKHGGVDVRAKVIRALVSVEVFERDVVGDLITELRANPRESFQGLPVLTAVFNGLTIVERCG
jgi:hypothetical protein